jgi:predicted alpha-1,6-mannanase (GH76 family)
MFIGRPVFILLLAWSVCVLGHAEECTLWKGRASTLVPAFVSRFVAENGGFYRDTTRGITSNYWYAPHALHTVVRASKLGILEKTEYAQFLTRFLDFHDAEGWYTPWIDDVDWMIEELVYALVLTGNNTALDIRVRGVVRELSEFVYQSWDTTCCVRGNPGGAWWDTRHTYKATASNAGAAIALSAAYNALGNSSLLVRGQLIFEYWRLNQVLESGQVLDGIHLNGTKDTRIFTYNEGMMLRACASLSQTNPAYVDYATPILRFLLQSETFPATGVLREQAPCGEDDMDCQEFKGITFRYVIDLIRAGGVVSELRSDLFRTLENSVASIWNFTNGTALPNNWEGPSPRQDEELLISSQTSAINAILAWTDYVCGGEQGMGASSTTMQTTTTVTTSVPSVPCSIHVLPSDRRNGLYFDFEFRLNFAAFDCSVMLSSFATLWNTIGGSYSHSIYLMGARAGSVVASFFIAGESSNDVRARFDDLTLKLRDSTSSESLFASSRIPVIKAYQVAATIGTDGTSMSGVWETTSAPVETSTPSRVLTTWQLIVSLLMSAVIVFVIGGVIVVVVIRKCCRKNNNSGVNGELVVSDGFATDQEDNEDLFEDL